MRRLLLAAVIAAPLFLLAPAARAQNVYDVPCPVTSQVINQTINPSNGHLKAYNCTDVSGNVNMPQTIQISNGAPTGSCQSSATSTVTDVDFVTGNWYTCGGSIWHLSGAAGGTISGTVTTFHIPFASAAGALSDISGSAVTAATGAISLTASADTVTPFEINSHSSTQSVQLSDTSMNSSTAGLGVVNIRGFGLNKWSDGSGTILAHFLADAPAGLAPVGWVVSNNRSGYNGNGSPAGAVSAFCSDVGLCQLTGGGTDANGNYLTLAYDAVGNGLTVSNSENNNVALTADFTVKNLQTMTTHDTQRWNNATVTMSGIDQNGAAYWNASSTKQVQINSAGFKTGVNDATAYSFLSNTAVVNTLNDLVDPDDSLSLVGSGNESQIGFFLKNLVNRPVVFQMIRVGTNGGQANVFVKPDGGSIFDATHTQPAPPYFFVDSPTQDATVYDTTSAVEISGGAGQNDALTLVGGSAGNATNLNFYLRAISARKAAIQANNSGTNGGGLSIYVKADGGGLTQVNSWNSTLETKFTPTIAAGTQTVSGCSLTSALGGSWTGSFHSGTTGTCTVTITPGGTATNGWQCDARNITTVADVVGQIAPLSTTTCVISGTTVSGDIVTWKATAF